MTKRLGVAGWTALNAIGRCARYLDLDLEGRIFKSVLPKGVVTLICVLSKIARLKPSIALAKRYIHCLDCEHRPESKCVLTDPHSEYGKRGWLAQANNHLSSSEVGNSPHSRTAEIHQYQQLELIFPAASQ